MGTAVPPKPVKPILGVIAGSREELESVPALVEPLLGLPDLSSDPIPFDFTDYYRAQMGADLWRQFHSFERLISPGSLAGLKIATNRLERETALPTAGRSGRRVNLDPGYLSADQVVLATTKATRHRIYQSDGIYGDLELYFERGSFHPWPWTYPDYRLEATVEFFNRARSIYLERSGDGEGT